jgi:hypothetical protein
MDLQTTRSLLMSGFLMNMDKKLLLPAAFVITIADQIVEGPRGSFFPAVIDNSQLSLGPNGLFLVLDILGSILAHLDTFSGQLDKTDDTILTNLSSLLGAILKLIWYFQDNTDCIAWDPPIFHSFRTILTNRVSATSKFLSNFSLT